MVHEWHARTYSFTHTTRIMCVRIRNVYTTTYNIQQQQLRRTATHWLSTIHTTRQLKSRQPSERTVFLKNFIQNIKYTIPYSKIYKLLYDLKATSVQKASVQFILNYLQSRGSTFRIHRNKSIGEETTKKHRKTKKTNKQTAFV